MPEAERDDKSFRRFRAPATIFGGCNSDGLRRQDAGAVLALRRIADLLTALGLAVLLLVARPVLAEVGLVLREGIDADRVERTAAGIAGVALEDGDALVVARAVLRVARRRDRGARLRRLRGAGSFGIHGGIRGRRRCGL